MKECKIGTCERLHFKDGYCVQHYIPPKNKSIPVTSNINNLYYKKTCWDDGI